MPGASPPPGYDEVLPPRNGEGSEGDKTSGSADVVILGDEAMDEEVEGDTVMEVEVEAGLLLLLERCSRIWDAPRAAARTVDITRQKTQGGSSLLMRFVVK